MAATPQVLLAGVDVTDQASVPQYSAVVNGIGEASFEISDITGALVPDEDAAVEIYEDGALAWQGEVASVSGAFFGRTGGIVCTVTCHDNNQLATRGEPLNATIPPQSLKATLQLLTTPGGALAALGVTLDPTQATGPTLDAITAVWMTPADLLAHLTEQTGWPYRIAPGKVLSMWDVGTRSSGVTLSLANGNFDDAHWTRERYEYRNRQWVVYGPTETRQVTDTHAGTGAQRVFVLRYAVATPPTSIQILPDAVTKQVGTYGVDALEWTYRASDRALVQDAGSAALTVSQSLEASFPSAFPNSLLVQDLTEVGARGPWNRVDTNPDLTTYAEAYAWGQALIRQNLPRPQMPHVTTRQAGIDAGETFVVALPEIALSQTCFARAVTTTWDESDEGVERVYAIEAVAGDELQADTIALWRRMLRGGAGGGGVGSASGGAVAAGSGPGLVSYALGVSTFATITGAGWQTPINAVRARVNSALFAGKGVAVVVHLQVHTAGASVQPRLIDEAGATVVGGPGAVVTPADGLDGQTLVIALTEGIRDYLIQFEATGASEVIYSYDATLEAGR